MYRCRTMADATIDKLTLEHPELFLRWLADEPQRLSLDEMSVVHMWGLVAMAALLGRGERSPIEIVSTGSSSASRFAHAVGFGAIRGESQPKVPLEPERTVRLARVAEFPAIEPHARQISNLIVEGSDDTAVSTRQVIYYVLVELLRNAVQHSRDSLGGVVAAQLMGGSSGQYANRPMIQVSVADCGIGIQQAMLAQHPTLGEAEEALEKALWPHWSGTFAQGLTGSIQNAGMGLFFIAEMAKLTAGRLLIASRGAALLLSGDPDAREDHHKLTFLEPKGLGFPGTLVTFELPSDEVCDYDALMQKVTERAKRRTPQRAIHHWLRYEQPPSQAKRFLISVASEDTVAAEAFSQQHVQPALLARTPVALSFVNMRICTQSFLHALLFEAIRIAWARRVPIYIEHASSAVRSGLDLLEDYALGG
jgi:hypothetical protein